jgi:hypothetical protein
MNPSAKWLLTISAMFVSWLPLVIGGVALRRLGSDSGIAWAHSLFMKDHPLNFGGNPVEVLSHLLDWLVMTGGMAALCVAAATASLLKAASIKSTVLRTIPKAAFPFTLFALTVWACCIDHESGEGTVLLAAAMFFTPFLLAIAFGLIKLHECRPGLSAELLPVPLLFGTSTAFQWVYERPGSGAPNILMFPAFAVLAGAFWTYCYFVTRRQSPEATATP